MELFTNTNVSDDLEINFNTFDFDDKNLFIIKYLSIFSIINITSITFLSLTLQNLTLYKCLDYNKQLYISKNIIKSIFLAYIFYMRFLKIISYIYYDNYDMKEIRYYGCIYVSCDLIGLLFIPKLPKTTQIHHSITVFLLFVIGNYDANQNDVVKYICIYTLWSFMSFIVNFYLGLRYFHIKEDNDYKLNKFDKLGNKIIDKIRVIAFYNYALCCFFNWIIHFNLLLIRIFTFNLDFTTIIYYILIIPIIRDDLILMSWLKNK